MIEADTVIIDSTGWLYNDTTDSDNCETGLISALDSQANSLLLTVASTFRNQGILQSRSSAALNIGSLGNSGQIIHAGIGLFNIDSQADVINNGTIFARTGDLKLTGGTLNNKDGDIYALAGDIRLDLAGTLSNTRGLLEAAEQLSIDTSQITDNNDGIISSLGTGDITLISNAVNNSKGTIQTNAHNLTLDIDSLNNNEGKLIHRGSGTLSLVFDANDSVKSIDNKGGTIVSLGRLVFTGFTRLINQLFNGQKAEIRAEHIELDGDVIDNTDGTIIATGNNSMDITTNNLGNTGGNLYSNGRLKLSSSSLNGQSGQIQSATDLELTLPNFDFSHGGFNARNSLTIYSSGLVTQAAGARFATDASLTVRPIAGESISWMNAGEISSLQDIEFHGSDLHNQPNGIISAGQELRLHFGGGAINNQGRLSGETDVLINAASVVNQGILAAGHDIQLDISGDVDNEQTIFAAEDVRLYVAGKFNNHQAADVFALNNITIAGNAMLAQNAGVSNAVGATIEAYNGDLYIATQMLENSQPLPTGITQTTSRISGEVFRPQKGGRIEYGSVALPFNEGYSVLQTDYPEQLDIFESYATTASWDRFWNHDSANRIKRFTVDVTRSRDEFAGSNNLDTPELLSGGALTIVGGDIRNQLGLIAASGDISLTGNNLDNIGVSLTEKITGSWLQGTKKKDASKRYVDETGTIAAETVFQTLPATIQAGGSVTTNFTGRFDNQNIRENTARMLSARRTGQTDFTGNGLDEITPEGETSLNGGTGRVHLTHGGRQRDAGNKPQSTQEVLPSIIDDWANFPLPTGDGLFVQNLNPHHTFLIETNPLFTSYTNFIGSDYLLTRLGYDPQSSTRRLGDAFYETHLVRDAIFERTGRRYLLGQNNEQTQLQYLMDNAVASEQSLNLSLGVALSAEQVAGLTHDIIWLVEQEVAGQTVLVPTYYAANSNNMNLQTDGALLLARDTSLKAGDITNTGTIEAEQELTLISEGDILNRGSLKSSKGDINLTAQGKIRNIGGGNKCPGKYFSPSLKGMSKINREIVVSKTQRRWKQCIKTNLQLGRS